MSGQTKLRTSRVLFPLILLLAIVGVQIKAQAQTPGNDLAQLNLLPEQIQKIRTINADLKDQRQAANQKFRQSQRALSEAVESPTPDEALINQRSHELADAQANSIRLRSLAESRILQVLTPEQRVRLREIRQRNQALRREGNQPQLPGNVMRRRQQGLQRNANLPPLRPNQRKAVRTATKP
jgi:Spy/CpxP family protein refolding chaperone